VAQNLITRNESVDYEELDEASKLQPDQKVKGYTLKHVKTSRPRATDDMDQPMRATVHHYEVYKGDQKVGELQHYHDSYYGHGFSGTMNGKKIKQTRLEGSKPNAANFLAALTKNEEVDYEDLDERKIMGYATGAARRKKMANTQPAKKQSMMDKIKSKLHLNGEEVEYDEEQLNEYSVRNNDYKPSHVHINKSGKDEPFKKPDTGITKPEKPIKEPEYKPSHVHINTKPINQNRMKDIKKMKEDYELYEGKMDDLEDARREKAEKKASEYKFGPKPKKTLATIRKIAGHSDSGAKRDDKEKDED
jgi:hypothetical protein